MKTEETLDYWLEEYSDNKNLLTRLEMAKNQASQTKDSKTSMLLNERDIKALIVGLTKTLQSNKKSIIDCAYKSVITPKEKKIEEKPEEKQETISKETQKKQANIVINTEKDFIQKFSAVLNTSNKVKIEFCCDLAHPIERITLIAIIKDVANISVEDARNTFDNRNIDRIDFLLDSERLRYYYNKLKDYIKYGGKLILQPIKQ